MTTNQTTPTTNLDWALHEAREEADRTRRLLVAAMRDLADNMATEADRLEADATRTVNSLGQVQGRGMNVDRLCALLDERRRTVTMLEHLDRRGADVEA